MIFHWTIPEVTPEATPLDRLIALLGELNKVLVEGRTVIPEGLSEPLIALVGIRRGSNALAFRLNDVLAPEYRDLTRCIKEREFGSVPRSQHVALLDLNKLLIHNGWSVCIEGDETLGIQATEISPHNPIPSLETRRFISGSTELFGQCIQVGGVSPKVRVKLADGKIIPAQTTMNTAKEVAMHLYEDVLVSGEATWDAESWAIVGFQLIALKSYDLPNPITAFQKLADLVGKSWEGVDASAFVRELRYGGEGA